MEIVPVDLPGVTHTGNFTDSLLVRSAESLLFVSGQIPETPDGDIPEDFAGQCRVAWQNLVSVLAANGLGIQNLVKVTVYLSSRRYREINKRIRGEFLGDHRCAIVVLVADMWDEPLLLTIDAIAAV